jgi:hypothetical protein
VIEPGDEGRRVGRRDEGRDESSQKVTANAERLAQEDLQQEEASGQTMTAKRREETRRRTLPFKSIRSKANRPTSTLTSSTRTSFLARPASSWNGRKAPVPFSIATISQSRMSDVTRPSWKSSPMDGSAGEGALARSTTGVGRESRTLTSAMMSGYWRAEVVAGG